MPGFGPLAALSFAGQGASQGANSFADIRQKYMQLQQLQMMLDAEKKKIATDPLVAAALGMNPGSGNSPPAGPGAAPGGALAPPSPPPGAPPSPMGGMPPQMGQARPPMQQPPPGGMQAPPPQMAAPAPPMPQQSPMQPQGAPPQAAGGDRIQQLQGIFNSGELDPTTQLRKIAQWVTSAPGNAEVFRQHPEYLPAAVERIVEMSHTLGVDPQTKFLMMSALQNQKDMAAGARTDARDATSIATTGMRDATSEANTGTRAQTAITTTGMRDATSTANVATREAGQDRRSAEKLAQAEDHFTRTFQRLTSSDKWKRMSAAQKQLYTQQQGVLKTRLSAAKAKLSAAVADPSKIDQNAKAAALKEIDQIDQALDRIGTVSGISSQTKKPPDTIQYVPTPPGQPQGQ